MGMIVVHSYSCRPMYDHVLLLCSINSRSVLCKTLHIEGLVRKNKVRAMRMFCLLHVSTALC